LAGYLTVPVVLLALAGFAYGLRARQRLALVLGGLGRREPHRGRAALFMTHPPMAERVRRLRALDERFAA
jgi:Zn-dependent protease with chaperone function